MFEMTQDDIDRSRKLILESGHARSESCPVSLAIKRKLKKKVWTIEKESCYLPSNGLKRIAILPHDVKVFINKYDKATCYPDNNLPVPEPIGRFELKFKKRRDGNVKV